MYAVAGMIALAVVAVVAKSSLEVKPAENGGAPIILRHAGGEVPPFSGDGVQNEVVSPPLGEVKELQPVVKPIEKTKELKKTESNMYNEKKKIQKK